MFHNFLSDIVFGKIGERGRLRYPLDCVSSDQIWMPQIGTLGILRVGRLLSY